MLGVAGTMLGRFWPNMGPLTVPVALYVGVLVAMACSALVARLPRRWRRWGRCALPPRT